MMNSIISLVLKEAYGWDRFETTGPQVPTIDKSGPEPKKRKLVIEHMGEDTLKQVTDVLEEQDIGRTYWTENSGVK